MRFWRLFSRLAAIGLGALGPATDGTAAEDSSADPRNFTVITFTELATVRGLPVVEGSIDTASEALAFALTLDAVRTGIEAKRRAGFVDWKGIGRREGNAARTVWRIVIRSRSLLPAAECEFVIDEHGKVIEPVSAVPEWRFPK